MKEIMMEINLNYKFKKLNGEVIPEQPDKIVEKDGQKTKKTYSPFTLRMLCENVLLRAGLDLIICPHCKTVIKRPKRLSARRKVKRFKLAEKIHNSNEIIYIRASDVGLLKKLIAKNYPSLTVGQAWRILDPASYRRS